MVEIEPQAILFTINLIIAICTVLLIYIVYNLIKKVAKEVKEEDWL